MDRGYLNQQLRSLASGMAPGESRRYRCPSCNGGSNKENSLVITTGTHHLVYHCFRAKCGLSGALTTDKNTNQPSRAKPKPRPYGGDLVPVSDNIYQDMFAKYGLSKEIIKYQGITYAKEVNRIKFPLYNYMGYVFGENLKAVSSEQQPKTLINKFNDVPSLHFPLSPTRGNNNTNVVLVEDQISAIKVSQIHYCAALMGTNISDEGMKQLMMLGIKTIILMLDGDAAGRSATIKLQRKLSPIFIVYSILLADNLDPKDVPLVSLNEEITKCLIY